MRLMDGPPWPEPPAPRAPGCQRPAARHVGLQGAQGRCEVRDLHGDRLLRQLIDTQLQRAAVGQLYVEIAVQHVLGLLQRLLVDFLLAIQRRPLGLLQGQADGQAHLRQLLAGQQRTNVLAGIEIDADVARDLLPPQLPGAVAVAPGDIAGTAFAFLEGRRERLQLVDLLAQRRQLHEQPGTVRLRQRAQGLEAGRQLGAGGIGAGIVLRAQDVIGALHQFGGAAHVLQGGQAQAGQTQQVFGLGQSPLLAALAEDLLQLLAKMLLVALQLHHKASPGLQFVRGGQSVQAGSQLLVALGQGFGLATGIFQLRQLVTLGALQLLDLPEAPATRAESRHANQQGEQRQAGGGTGTPGCIGCNGRRGGSGSSCVVLGSDCFAHRSILWSRKF